MRTVRVSRSSVSMIWQASRDVRVSPDGYIYLLTDEAAGAIVRLEPAN